MTLIANADAALYRAKSEARGSVRFFEMSMDTQLRERRALQQDLRNAIGRDEFMLHYQPQAQIDGKITGFEALVRWHHPRCGAGAAQRTSFRSPRRAASSSRSANGFCAAPAARRPPGRSRCTSPSIFRRCSSSAATCQAGAQVLLETGLSPSRLELEITEGVLIGDFTRRGGHLRRLKNLGVRIAMDDFGTGYSSLSYLQSFPFDKIKIDRAFVANLGHSRQSVTIIRAVIALGRGLDLPVVAEGVETEEQLTFLRPSTATRSRASWSAARCRLRITPPRSGARRRRAGARETLAKAG